MSLVQNLIISTVEIKEPTDKVILPQSFLDSILRRYSNQDLPYPLTFAIRSNNRKTHVGVREFSAEEGTVILPDVVLDNLAIKTGMPVSVSLAQLEKGESVKLRPLKAGYDLNQDWKVALEGAFRSTYTTLTRGDVIRLRSGMRFLVDELEPHAAVCIVDTDLEVELEPLSEEQALETVKASAVSKSTSAVRLEIDQVYEGAMEIQSLFDVQGWNRDQPLLVSLEASDPDTDLAIDHGDKRPMLSSNIWSNVNSRSHKEIEIQPSNTALEGIKTLQIAIISTKSASYSLLVTQSKQKTFEIVVHEDEVRCPNCSVVVPKRSLILHERHCNRNNTRCLHSNCDFIYKKGLETNHWHCEECGDPGEGSLELHASRFHVPHTCECSMTLPNLPSLAHHRATSCPDRIIICRFCHLSVPQGDPSDLSYQDLSQGFSAHESACGSRTTTCDSCNHLVKLKDLPTHLKIHDSQRLTHSVPMICTNANCIHPQGTTNPLRLCNECLGPLYSSQTDDDGTKFQARLKRRYLSQLMTGCKRSFCQNRYCATATDRKLSYTDATATVNDRQYGTRHWFCVSEAVQKKRTMAEVLESEGEYGIEWCCRAMELSGGGAGDVSRARGWLSREAVKKSEM